MSAPQLYRLVYYSQNRLASSPSQAESEIESILASARRNNAQHGITGALIFNSGIFAQVLEGELRTIETIFEHIQRDERHGDVHVLAFEKTSERNFPHWSMGYIGKSHVGENLFGHISKDTRFEARLLEGERVFEVMRRIAMEDERRAA